MQLDGYWIDREPGYFVSTYETNFANMITRSNALKITNPLITRTLSGSPNCAL